MMAYFSNGTEGRAYMARFCVHCVHDEPGGCPIIGLHLLHNYEECNKPDSFLHVLIPRSVNGSNEQCTMFVEVTHEQG